MSEGLGDYVHIPLWILVLLAGMESMGTKPSLKQDNCGLVVVGW